MKYRKYDLRYIKDLRVNEQKKEVRKRLKLYNNFLKTNFKVVDIYRVPNLETERVIAKIADNKNEEIISIRGHILTGIPDIFGFELINYSHDLVYNLGVRRDGSIPEPRHLDEYIKWQSDLGGWVEELSGLRDNIKANNIKKRIARK